MLPLHTSFGVMINHSLSCQAYIRMLNNKENSGLTASTALIPDKT